MSRQLLTFISKFGALICEFINRREQVGSAFGFVDASKAWGTASSRLTPYTEIESSGMAIRSRIMDSGCGRTWGRRWMGRRGRMTIIVQWRNHRSWSHVDRRGRRRKIVVIRVVVMVIVAWPDWRSIERNHSRIFLIFYFLDWSK